MDKNIKIKKELIKNQNFQNFKSVEKVTQRLVPNPTQLLSRVGVDVT